MLKALEDTQNSWWLYTVWFRNTLLDANDPEDQDYNWVACIAIEAQTYQQAVEWGDHLSNGYISSDSTQEFIESEAELLIENPKEDISTIPFIRYGYEASDDEIGW